jgi:hypothetical protein
MSANIQDFEDIVSDNEQNLLERDPVNERGKIFSYIEIIDIIISINDSNKLRRLFVFYLYFNRRACFVSSCRVHWRCIQGILSPDYRNFPLIIVI